MRQPQSLLLRKALFQIHLWAGIGCGLYVLLISVSGSALVYRRELAKIFSREPVVIASAGGPLTLDRLKQSASAAYPGYEIAQVTQPRSLTRPVEIDLTRNGIKKRRLFNPYTGADLGNAMSTGFRAVLWLADFHDNLLLGEPAAR